MSTVAYPHIEVRSNGKAYIAGTGFKVRLLAQEYLATGVDAIELQRGHPQLTLSQVYSALAYYHDHKEEFDREIEVGRALAEALHAEQGESTLISKARAAGRKLP